MWSHTPRLPSAEQGRVLQHNLVVCGTNRRQTVSSLPAEGSYPDAMHVPLDYITVLPLEVFPRALRVRNVGPTIVRPTPRVAQNTADTMALPGNVSNRGPAGLKESIAGTSPGVHFQVAERPTSAAGGANNESKVIADKAADDALALSKEPVARQKKAESQQLVDGWQEVLQKQYSRNPYPTSEDYDRLSNETGMERRLVLRWFINMRKGGVSKPYNDSGTSGRAAAPSPRRSKANHSIMKVEPELEKAFEEHTYPTPLQYQQIAERLGVEKKLVRRWFIGRRRLKANNESKLIADKAAADALALSKKPVASVSSLSSSTTPSPSPTAAQRARPADAATSKEAPVAVSAVVVPLQINGGGLRGASSDADAPGTDQPKVAPVVPVSPSTYSFTNSDGVTVSVVQAVGLDELDSKELAAIAGEDDGRLNGEYALASYVDDVELGEFVNGASAVSQVGSL